MRKARALPRRLLGGLVACGLLLFSGTVATASVWTPSVRKKMVADALKVAPPTLARQIRRHAALLLAGMADAAVRGEGASHRQESDQASGAAVSLALTAQWVVAAMEERRPMADVVYRLGVVSHYAADLSDPILTDPRGTTAAFAADYARYVEGNLSRYPVVFYGYPAIESLREAGADRGDPGAPAGRRIRADALAQARHARAYFEHLERAYALSGGRSEPFDERSLPFGIGSLAYSRAVTGIARAWLHVWAAARGDLSGTPHLEGAPPLPSGLGTALGYGSATPPLLEWSPPAGAGAASRAGEPPAAEAGRGAEPIRKTIYGKSRKERTKSESDATED